MLSKEQIIGLFFLGALIVLGLAVEVTVGTRFLRPGYSLSTVFNNVGGLNSGAMVRVGGVKAGTVDKISVDKNRVMVQMTIGEHFHIYKGAVARLETVGLGGQRFVSISLGDPEKGEYKDGDTIAGEELVSVGQLIRRVDAAADSIGALAESFDRDSAQLLAALSSMVEENRLALTESLERVASITAKIDRGQGTLGKLVNDDTLYHQLTGSLEALRESLTDIGIVAARLERGEGTLGRLIADDSLYREAEETVASLRSTADQFERISAGLEGGQGTLGRLIVDDSLYLDAQDAVQNVRRATQSVEDQAPLSILGTFAASLF